MLRLLLILFRIKIYSRINSCKKKKKNNEAVFFPLYLLERNHDSIKSKSNEKKFRDVALILLLLTIETVFNNFQNEIYKYTFYKLKFDLQSL